MAMETSTTIDDIGLTRTWGGLQNRERLQALVEAYHDLIEQRRRLNWTEHLQLIRKLGHGGQGVVYLSQRRGADGFTLPVALK
ncbi:MAG: serine/threonine protein kinase, partial [Chloroflexi bacterium]|nr:serine/threonine protein kinase [Chloroflexota bacterium]